MPISSKKLLKRYSKAKLVDAIAIKMQKLVRLKAADENGMVKCWTSGAMVHWSEAQGGHFISRTHKRTKIIEENIHPQTAQQNLWGMKDSLTVLAYRRAMVEFYGEDFVTWLETEAKKPLDTPRAELEEMFLEVKAQVSELEKTVGCSNPTAESDY
jgi:hypothetical protein